MTDTPDVAGSDLLERPLERRLGELPELVEVDSRRRPAAAVDRRRHVPRVHRLDLGAADLRLLDREPQCGERTFGAVNPHHDRAHRHPFSRPSTDEVWPLRAGSAETRMSQAWPGLCPTRSMSSSATAARSGSSRRPPPTPTIWSAFFAGLSERSLYLRFHGYRAVDREPRRAAPRSRLDQTRGARSVGSTGPASRRIVAVASYVAHRQAAMPRRWRSRSPTREQGRGIGTRLLEQLARTRARERHRALRRRCPGLEPHRARRLRRRRLRGRPRARCGRGRGALPDRCRPSSSRRGSRSATTPAVVASLRPFFEPRSVAVIGASRRRGSIGGELFRNILDGRLRRRRLPRQPARRAGRRRPRVPLGRGDPGPGRPRGHLPPGRAGARRRRGRARARRAGALRDLGRASPRWAPRAASGRSSCSRSSARTARGWSARTASASPSRRHGLNATFAPRALPAGRIGFSSQSGALGLALLEKATERSLGLLVLRLDRQQGRRLVERPARVVGGRRARPISSCSTSSRSATRARSRASLAASRGASRSSR